MPDPAYAPTAASDLKWLLQWYFGFQYRFFFNKPFTPPTLNLLVTLRCDMRCRHCFLWERLEDPAEARELSLDEIETMARTMGPLFSLVLSGGEPFLRKDLAEIARAFHQHTRVKVLTLLTGGQMTQRVCDVTQEILRRCPEILVVVGVSLDGVGPRHDAIRQKPGAFDRAVRTVRTLKDLAASQDRLSVQACVCLTGLNQDHIFDLYAYLRDDLRPDRIAVNLMRQDAPDPAARNVSPVVYERLIRTVCEDTCSGMLRNRFAFDRFAFMTVADLCMTRMIAATLREGRPQIRCRAGSVSSVVFPDGAVYPCEMKPDWGNLKEFGFDFARFWAARREKARREGALPGRACFCTHEIDCFLPSIPFDVRLYPGLARQWFRVVRGQWRTQARPDRFSVVVVSPAGGIGSVAHLLESLARQSYRNFQVVMVTRGGQEAGGRDPVEPYRERLPDVKVVSAAGHRIAEARNRGARAADARDLLFLDPAVCAGPDFLKDLVHQMRRAGLVLAAVRRGRSGPGRFSRFFRALVPDRLRWILQRFLPVRPCDAIVVRQEVFEAVGGFDPDARNAEAVLVRKGARLGRFRWLVSP